MDDGPPRSVTIYATQDGWRFAIATEKGSVLGGRYPELPSTAPAEDARLVAERNIQSMGREAFDLALRVEWQSGPKAGWWDGTVVQAADPS